MKVHNETLSLALIARVVYLKDSTKENDPVRIARLALRLLQDRHLSVFEHQWFYVSLSDFKEDRVGSILGWFSSLFLKPLPVTFKNQIYYDKGILAFTARTFLQGLELNAQKGDFYALPQDLVEHVKYQLLAHDELGYKLYFERESFEDYITSHQIRLNEFELMGQVELPEFGENSFVGLVSKTQLSTQLDAYTFKLANVPITIVRQLVRHRFGVITEQSLRVINAKKRDYLLQPTKKLRDTCAEEIYERSKECYDELLQNQFKKEDAREILPLGTRTTLYWTVPKISLENYLELRLSKHAQEQHRVLATAIKQLLDI